VGYPLGIGETHAHRNGSLAALREEYLAAVSALDLRASRRIVLDAFASGLSLGRLYGQVIRPGLLVTGAALGDSGATAYERLVLGNVKATLALLGARPARERPGAGQGREALVSVGQRPLEALDGQVIADVLSGDGWHVTEIAVGTSAIDVAALAIERRVELVVMPTSRAADLLADAAAYTELRRLDDPPLIVACSLGERDDARRARAAGADAFLGDLDELLSFVSSWLPPAGTRHWGVRLQQRSDTLVITPTGSLDTGSVERLRQVVASRAGRHRAFVVDSRSVAAVTEDGLDALLGWLSEPATDARPPRLVAGDGVTGSLAATHRPSAGALLLDAAEI
jgi:CheY-like chemotaxis protein